MNGRRKGDGHPLFEEVPLVEFILHLLACHVTGPMDDSGLYCCAPCYNYVWPLSSAIRSSLLILSCRPSHVLRFGT